MGQEIHSKNYHLIIAKGKPDTIASYGIMREVWYVGKVRDFKEVWNAMLKKLAEN
jgi:hypothetical protein